MRSCSICACCLVLLAGGCAPREPAPPTVDELKVQLESQDEKVQIEALRWVVELGPKASATKSILIASLKSPRLSVRQGAALALGKIGPDAVDAVPALADALQDPEPSVQQAAAATLGEFGPAAASAIPQLRALAGDSSDPCDAAPLALKKILKQ